MPQESYLRAQKKKLLVLLGLISSHILYIHMLSLCSLLFQYEIKLIRDKPDQILKMHTHNPCTWSTDAIVL